MIDEKISKYNLRIEETNTKEKLLDIKNELSIEITNIKAELKKSKKIYEENGIEIPYEWRIEKQKRKKTYHILIKRCETKLSQIKSEKKEYNIAMKQKENNIENKIKRRVIQLYYEFNYVFEDGYLNELLIDLRKEREKTDEYIFTKNS